LPASHTDHAADLDAGRDAAPLAGQEDAGAARDLRGFGLECLEVLMNQAPLHHQEALLGIDLDFSGLGRRCEQESNEGEGQSWVEVAHETNSPWTPCPRRTRRGPPAQDLRHVLALEPEVGALPAILAAFARVLQHRAEGDDLSKPLPGRVPFSYSLWHMAWKVSGRVKPQEATVHPDGVAIDGDENPQDDGGPGMFCWVGVSCKALMRHSHSASQASWAM